jgi:hypothetical protein
MPVLQKHTLALDTCFITIYQQLCVHETNLQVVITNVSRSMDQLNLQNNNLAFAGNIIPHF